MRRVLAPVLLLGLLVLAPPAGVIPAHGLCAGGSGDRDLPVVFVGIAMGKDVEGPREPYWPHRFEIEEIERGLEGFEIGDVIDIDLVVNERFEGGMGLSVEDNLGDAPFVGARYRVGAYTSDAPEGVRYHSNGCGGSLTRLSDPIGAEPHQQVLPTGEGLAIPEASTAAEADPKESTFPGPRSIAAGLAALVVAAALLARRLRRQPNSTE